MSNGGNERQDPWAARISAAGVILGPVLTMALVWYQGRETRREAQAAAEQAKVAATKVEAKGAEIKNTLDLSRNERRKEFGELSEKHDAELQAWKAYQTKEPEDMNKAAEAIARVADKADIQTPAKTVP